MDQTLKAAVDEVLARTEPLVERIKHGGGEEDLRKLRQSLCHLPSEIERCSDITSIAQDLCDAAAALIAGIDATTQRQHLYREARLRLFCEIHGRFLNQLREIASSRSEPIGR